MDDKLIQSFVQTNKVKPSFGVFVSGGGDNCVAVFGKDDTAAADSRDRNGRAEQLDVKARYEVRPLA